MMSTTRHIKERFPILPTRSDHGDVGKMAASSLWMVSHQYIPWTQVVSLDPHLLPYSFTHSTQVNRQVRGIGHQATGGIKDCAGEVQTLLDVGRDRSALQRPAHLFRDRHEQVAEN